MQTPWRIELFGSLQAESDGKAVTRFATHATAALLARLALWPRRVHAREELAELLWPDVPAEVSRARLRQALTSLRHQLEPPGVASGSVLIADRTYIRLNPSAISTDVADFEAAFHRGHAADARHVYRGELLPGFYEDWVIDERERLAALFAQIEGGAPDRPTNALLSPEVAHPDEYAATNAAEENRSAARLPIQFTRFFGRTEELSEIAKLLREFRLVTLTGPGGAGKTRLAVEAAREMSAAVPVVFVGLADVVRGADRERLASAVADALRLPREGGAVCGDLDAVVAALSPRPTLLLLDNAEQVSVAAGQLVLTLLSRVPHLRVLVTSRRRLHIAGERELPVPPLPVPDPEGDHAPEEIATRTAVQLFVDRAQTARPDFQLTPRNAADVAALCRALEGAPLAIELAAARAATITPGQMRSHLAHRFEFLASRRTDKDARHRSLWAAISWSVDLLPEALQSFWSRLAVFRGGFTADAATMVTGEKSAQESLAQLRERSLLAMDDGETEMRFRLLESLREFACLQWSDPARQEIERLHGAYFLRLAEAGVEALRGSDQSAWLNCLESEHDNFRAALTLAVESGDGAFAQQLAGSLWSFWERRGYLTEGRQWLERALALPGSAGTRARAFALNRLGAALNLCGSLDEAAAIHEATRETYQTLGDVAGIALAWNRLGVVASRRGDYDAAIHAFAQALERERALENRFNTASALIGLGIATQRQAAYAAAHVYFAEALSLFRILDNPAGIADALLNIAAVCMAEQRWDEALPYLEEAGGRFERLQDRWSRAYVTFAYAMIARHEARWADAESLAHTALVVCREVGDRAKAADIIRHLAAIARLTGDNAKAHHRLVEALALYRDLGQSESASDCQREIDDLRTAQTLPAQP